MLELAWLDETAQSDFDPECLSQYNWNRQTIASGCVLPDHFLSFSTVGDSTIEIQMFHSSLVSPDLSRRFFIFFDGNNIQLEFRSIYISGHLPKDIAGLSQSERDYINRMDHRYRTNDQLNQLWPQLWKHYVFSAFERWRRTRENHRWAEFALDAASSRLLGNGKPLDRLARLMPLGPRTCKEFIMRQIRAEYSHDVKAVRTLRQKIDDFPHATQVAKSAALEAFNQYAQYYSIDPSMLNSKLEQEDGNPSSGLSL